MNRIGVAVVGAMLLAAATAAAQGMRYGVGASARSRPSCFSSAQSADGIM